MVLSAQSIRNWADSDHSMIYPFCERTVLRGRSYGLSSCGYDVRVDFGDWLEPGSAVALGGEGVLAYPIRFILAATWEHFRMPPNVMGVVHDESSWARQGLTVQNTVIETGWRGYLTLELTYHGEKGKVLQIEQGDPIAQIVFHQLDERTEQPYDGKYQDQPRGPQEVRFE